MSFAERAPVAYDQPEVPWVGSIVLEADLPGLGRRFDNASVPMHPAVNWPPLCSCCLRSADDQLVLVRSVRDRWIGKRYVIGKVPYCRVCTRMSRWFRAKRLLLWILLVAIAAIASIVVGELVSLIAVAAASVAVFPLSRVFWPHPPGHTKDCRSASIVAWQTPERVRGTYREPLGVTYVLHNRAFSELLIRANRGPLRQEFDI